MTSIEIHPRRRGAGAATRPGPLTLGDPPLRDLASQRVDSSLHDASRRVCRAMLLLAPLRDSHDPELRAAYENIHDVMGDLASIHHWTALATMPAPGGVAGQVD
ncbi:hypothetical protein [Nocardioides panaciterrulae]|uniref:Uncharacterized protein n=1 Tax=Nocardioides panaciterrulae TaxID=661492 RepID=A0A7Y9E5H4_9ACTN|nr:hypothetical protein [Nocardioides panaciterrulae]NYD41285.1 hypothetical protein [Nocardioides panaciterrulae]